MGKTDQDIQSRNQASTKSVKMSPILFFTVLIVAASGFEVNQTAAAGYENRRPANLREQLIRAKLPKPLPSRPKNSSFTFRDIYGVVKDTVAEQYFIMYNGLPEKIKWSVVYTGHSASSCEKLSGRQLNANSADRIKIGSNCKIEKVTAVWYNTAAGTACTAANNVGLSWHANGCAVGQDPNNPA